MRRLMMLAAALLVMAGVMLVEGGIPPDGWRVPMACVTNSGQQGFPQVCTNGDTVHVAWIDNRDGYWRIYHKQSYTWGLTWENDGPVSPSGSAVLNFKGALSLAGIGRRLYAVWVKSDGGTYSVRFARSTNDGQNWFNYQTLASGLIEMAEVSITAAADSVRLIYHRRTASWEGLVYTAAGLDASPWSPVNYIQGNYHYPHLTTLGGIPQAVFVFPYQKTPRVSTVVLHARYVPGSGWQLHGILQGLDPDNFRYPHITTDLQGRLHVIWENRATGEVRYARSTNAGNDWEYHNLLVQCQSSCSYLASSNQGVLVVFDSLRSDGRPIFGRFSSDFGEEWSDTFRLVNLATDETPECFLVTGTRSRHLIFQKNNVTGADLSYLAQDDVLLSSEPDATAPSSGRHLLRDFMNNRLHLVYFSQGRPHYTYSDDEGTTWVRYHIVDNIVQSSKDRGKYPSIGLYASASETFEPCMAYVSPASTGDTLKYRWWNDFTGQWDGFFVYGAGIHYGAPSVMCFGSDVGLVIVSEDISQSWVLYYQFRYDAPAPDLIELIANGVLNRFRSPCLTVDGNWDRHVVYEENGEIVYMRRFAPNDWRPYPPFPPSVPYWSQTPFIEAYGDHLFAPYAEYDGSSSYYDIYRRYYNLYEIPPRWSDPPFPVSQSLGIPSESPVAAWGDFTVWAEQGWGDIEFDSKYYWHPQDQMGFVSIEPLNSCHHHAQMYYDWLGGGTVLMTAWTLGLLSTAPYRIAFRKMSLLPPPDGFGSYYTVTTGEEKPSFFCSKRDTFVRYQRYKVDYGKTELTYQLPLLNPVYPGYRVKILSYFEGSSNRTEQVLVDGRMVAPISIKPNVLNISEVLIPRECYQDDHRASLSFKGADVTKAGLVIYQLEKAKVGSHSGGGSQSAETSPTSSDDLLKIEPNPSRGRTTVTYGLARDANVRSELYDASGRLVQVLVKQRQTLGVHRVLLPSHLPAGVYFVKLDLDGECLVKKLAVMR